MKKILFVVCTHGDELSGFNLFLKYPYGKNNKTEWEVVLGNPEAAFLNTRFIESDLNREGAVTKAITYEQKRSLLLKEKMKSFDVVYDIHTTTAIRDNPIWNRCIFVNSLEKGVIDAIFYVKKSYVIYDSDPLINKQYITANHPVGITLEYVKHPNIKATQNHISNDFFSIINEKHNSSNHIFLEFERSVSQKEKSKLNINFKEFFPLSTKEKKLLNLPSGSGYYPVFVNPPEIDPKYYCFLNKKIDGRKRK